GEEARALEDDVDAERLPRQLRRVLDREDLDGLAADGHRLVRVADGNAPELAVDRVVAEQVRQRLRVGEVVDGHELEVLDPPLVTATHGATPNLPKAVDRVPGCHPGCS